MKKFKANLHYLANQNDLLENTKNKRSPKEKEHPKKRNLNPNALNNHNQKALNQF
jgi:hypothetical protein